MLRAKFQIEKGEKKARKKKMHFPKDVEGPEG